MFLSKMELIKLSEEGKESVFQNELDKIKEKVIESTKLGKTTCSIDVDVNIGDKIFEYLKENTDLKVEQSVLNLMSCSVEFYNINISWE